MRTLYKTIILLFLTVVLLSCNRNYYSGSGKGGKNCGCPGTHQR